MPPLSFSIFELGIFAVAAVVLARVWRTDRYLAVVCFALMVFAGYLEISDIKATGSYYYARFLFMLGKEPGWFPLYIAIAWGLVIYSVTTLTDRLPVAWYWRPFADAFLALSVDLVLDPMVASSRWVPHLMLDCEDPGFPGGSAVGIGFWIWCVVRDSEALWFGIPSANYFAWLVVVLVASFLMRIGDRWLSPRTRPFPQQVLIAAGTAALCFSIVFGVLKGYVPLLLYLKVPEWVVVVVPCAVGLGVIVAGGASRVRDDFMWQPLAFPICAFGYSWGAFLPTGVAARATGVFTVAMALCTAGSVLVLLWVMRGRRLLGRARPSLIEEPESTPMNLDEQLTDIARIVTLTDGAARNILITQRYHDLSAALSRVVGRENANWATFAAWASKTAGDSIRDEEVPRAFVDLLGVEQAARLSLEHLAVLLGLPVHRHHDLFDDARAVLRDVSQEVAAGNLKVFAELAPFFARFSATFADDAAFDAGKWDAFAGGFRPGPPEADGQDLLRAAFRGYYEARFEPDPRRKAQRVLLSNGQVGLHEQTRLQPNIRAALDAPISELLCRRAADRVGAGSKPDTNGLSVIDGLWERLATRFAMQLDLPGGKRACLGEDVCVGATPPDLVPIEFSDLVTLFVQFRAPLAGDRDTAGRDWAVLDDRMRFILVLFRDAQQQASLFDQPIAALRPPSAS